MAAAVATPAADPTQRRFRGCAKITDYEITGKLGEGTFGVVSKGLSKRTGSVVALKKILMHNEKDGFPITALREIKLLKMLSHPNVVQLDEMAVERKKGDGKKRATMYMITPYMDHDLSGMTTNPDIQFTIPQIKCYMLQLLEGLRYLHDSHILHRDMKAANILISNKGQLQIADFGLARHYEGPTPRPGHGNGDAVRDYTTLVVTRWYRPPELLLQLRRYTPAIDIWGAGCVFAELFERRPILEGKTDLNQAEIIFELVGSPNENTMPGWAQLPGCEGVRQWATKRGNISSRFRTRLGDDGLDLLQNMLTLDWRKRVNAYDALKHRYFTTDPLPARPEELPRFEDSHELDRRKHHEKRAALPPAPAGGTVGMGPDEAWGPPGANGDYGPYYGDRGRYPRDGRDRGPPGPGPPRRYDDRRDERRPAWARPAGDRPPPPYANGARNGSAEPDRRAPVDGRARGGNVDTYVPAYRDRDRDAPRDRDREPLRRDDRDHREPLRRGDERDRDRDRDPPRRDDRDKSRDLPSRRDDREPRREDRDRDRERDPRGTRSRSPISERGRERRDGPPRRDDRDERQRTRERLQDREREMYRQR
ncbi:hypothetical protein CAC42_705 [Sphaceloma murrayae]|uniref:Serine/threonine-protein kinase BUR1 n=1 Tax=Sphaceloma murrayae TaxID=2082308 RepID=A0A2K1QJX8_9PEZI|nr:hypothetical protein CAC42_705 [Sphaceloma murrayae]